MSQQFSIEMYHFDISIKDGMPAFEVAECNGGNYSTVALFPFPALSDGKAVKLSIDTTAPQPLLVVDAVAQLPTSNPAFALPSSLWNTIQFWRYKDPYDNVEIFFGTEDLRACSFRIHAAITLSQSEVYITRNATDNKLQIYVPNNGAAKKVVQ